MIGQVASFLHGLAAHFTGVWLDSCMFPTVDVQLVFLLEVLAAFSTPVGLFTRVLAPVTVQFATLSEGRSTQVTQIRTFACMKHSTHKYTHTHTHKYTHKYTHTQVHTHTHTCKTEKPS